MLRSDPEAELSAIIADIYDAALDPRLWPSVLPRAAEYVGGQAAAILAKKAAEPRATMFYYCGVAPQYMQSYLEQHWRYDSFGIVEQMDFPIGRPIVTDDLVPYDEFVQDRFFKEWAEPQGWIDSIWVVLERSADSFAFFSVLRDIASGRVDGEVIRRMALIAPHLRRAVLIGNVIDLARSEAASFAGAFEHLRAAVFFLDAEGRVVVANAAGRRMVDSPFAPLRLLDGRLAARDEAAQIALRGAYREASAGDTTLGSAGLALPLDGEPRHVAHVLPLTEGARRTSAFGAPATVALFVQPEELPQPAAPELIATAYGLTPAELRVLLAIVEVGGVPEVAEALGVAETTVKTHLGRLYDKTGLKRQADLVKLFASFGSPLLG